MVTLNLLYGWLLSIIYPRNPFYLSTSTLVHAVKISNLYDEINLTKISRRNCRKRIDGNVKEVDIGISEFDLNTKYRNVAMILLEKR